MSGTGKNFKSAPEYLRWDPSRSAHLKIKNNLENLRCAKCPSKIAGSGIGGRLYRLCVSSIQHRHFQKNRSRGQAALNSRQPKPLFLFGGVKQNLQETWIFVCGITPITRGNCALSECAAVPQVCLMHAGEGEREGERGGGMEGLIPDLRLLHIYYCNVHTRETNTFRALLFKDVGS